MGRGRRPRHGHGARPSLRRARRVAVAAFLALATVAALLARTPAAARAEDPLVTSQARLANAEFLAFAPPPPGEPGAVCLVDTGLDLNPDTEPNVLERLALDGGDPGDVFPTKHGTRMAMLMGGAANDWGGVGLWPYLRVVSVRAMPPGESSFPFDRYKRAIGLCGKRVAAGLPLRAVNLSLGGVGSTPEGVEQLADYVAQAHRQGMSVTAGAGNDGREVGYPAAVPGVLAVGALAPAGELCSFSSRGRELDLQAPGCELDVALPDGRAAYGHGTSDASALVAAALTALRSYRPGLGPGDAEELLLSASRQAAAGPALDVGAAFRAAGLGDVVDAGNAAAARHAASPEAGRHDADDRPLTGALARRLPRPALRSLRYRGRRLLVRVANRPPGAALRGRIVYASGRAEFDRRERSLERVASAVRIAMPRRWLRVELEYRYFEAQPSRRLVLSRRSVVRSNMRLTR